MNETRQMKRAKLRAEWWNRFRLTHAEKDQPVRSERRKMAKAYFRGAWRKAVAANA